MTAPSVSVIIVSRGRPKLLQLCLLAVSKIQYVPFEVVVVADQAGLDAVGAMRTDAQFKTALCKVANVSIARNIGLGLASGDVVAFIDDDSVPEPGWLFHLAAVFDDAKVVAAGGYVRGRNGISYQTKAQKIDAVGWTQSFEIKGDKPVTLNGEPTLAIKTVGTNCAFRRSLFEKIGGFDPAFAYYLDESDLNMRVAKAGFKTAIVPLAQVHHQTSASERRRQNRVPLSLFDVGKSASIFLRKHSPDADHNEQLSAFAQVLRRRLKERLLRGQCKRRDVSRLLETLKSGIVSGHAQVLHQEKPIAPVSKDFQRLRNIGAPLKPQTVEGFRFNGKKLRKKAAALADADGIVTLFIYSRTTLFHRVRFHPNGYWEHSGGLFGRAERTEPLFRRTSLKNRVRKECNRVALVRHPWDIGSCNSD